MKNATFFYKMIKSLTKKKSLSEKLYHIWFVFLYILDFDIFFYKKYANLFKYHWIHNLQTILLFYYRIHMIKSIKNSYPHVILSFSIFNLIFYNGFNEDIQMFTLNFSYLGYLKKWNFKNWLKIILKTICLHNINQIQAFIEFITRILQYNTETINLEIVYFYIINYIYKIKIYYVFGVYITTANYYTMYFFNNLYFCKNIKTRKICIKIIWKYIYNETQSCMLTTRIIRKKISL